ncbi:DUF922 domain-containing protein [Pseudoalteromonas sp. T1lg48]|uniref:DUF922 domain-containing protein n=1 Tax=Pseudoalteromonas sp. T1lg48 TaxID=2077100 RepID=UPI001319C96A|nr:DUF922 domain-containing protein [Pseudoalteromonas sp. T1lg48]
MRLILVVMFLSLPAYGKLDVRQSTQNYPVYADVLSELLVAVDSASPVKRGTRVEHGYTHHQIGWEFWFNSRARQCQVNKLTTRVEIEYTLPKLDSYSEAVKKLWSRWYPHLAEYQRKQGVMIIAAAERLDKQLEALPQLGNCRILEQQAQRISEQVQNELALALEQLQQQTEFGRSENAWLVDHLN